MKKESVIFIVTPIFCLLTISILMIDIKGSSKIYFPIDSTAIRKDIVTKNKHIKFRQIYKK